MSDFHSGESVRARKPHQCEYCYGKIQVWEVHHRQGGIWDGEWQNWRMHLDCLDAHGRENDESHGNGEICQEPHQRGRTCGETEDERFKFEGELTRFVKEYIAKGEAPNALGRAVLSEVEEWQELESRRVELAGKAHIVARVKRLA